MKKALKLKNCPNFIGLLPVSLWIGPKSEYSKLLCLLYSLPILRFVTYPQGKKWADMWSYTTEWNGRFFNNYGTNGSCYSKTLHKCIKKDLQRHLHILILQLLVGKKHSIHFLRQSKKVARIPDRLWSMRMFLGLCDTVHPKLRASRVKLLPVIRFHEDCCTCM